MKGVSEIIANILMLIITIGLAGTAYVYISGMLTTKLEKTISVLDASCNGSHILLVINNDGTATLGTDEFVVYINNQRVQPNPLSSSLAPHTIAVLTDLGTGVKSGSNTVLVVSPSNSIRHTIWC